ncbi:MAG: peroxiredoxin-like family protein [Verrucomicrobiota bacterium]
MSSKLASGGPLPEIQLPLIEGGTATLGETQTPGAWKFVLVYRGLHCPVCNRYLKQLQELKEGYAKANTEILALSADTLERAQEIAKVNGLEFPIAYGLNVDQMDRLGLYISQNRPDDDVDYPFPEPGVFVLNAEGKLQVIEISNIPFHRAELKELLETIEWIQENDYPLRGAYPEI